MNRAEAPLRRSKSPDGESWYALGYHRDEDLGRRLAKNIAAIPATRYVFVSGQLENVWTFGNMHAEACKIASSFLDLGLKAGDRIAVQLPNSPECVMIYLAALHLGLVIVPIIMIFGDNEVKYIVEESGSRLLISPADVKRRDVGLFTRELMASGALKHAIFFGGEHAGCGESWDRFVARSNEPAAAGPNRPDEPAFILYTSGTTSRPKGVRHTHNTMGAEYESDNWSFKTKSPVWLNIYPAGHMAGLTFLIQPFFSGGDTYILEKWDVADALRLIEQYRVTHTGGTPFHLAKLMEEVQRSTGDISSIEYYSIGGSAVDPQLVVRAHMLGAIAVRCYGSTEHPSITASSGDSSLDARGFTDGHLLRGNRIRIVDDNGEDVEPGAEGEVVANGPEQFAGYTRAEDNADAFLADTWFRTGDIGRFEGGLLKITDRKKDIIIRGGENISAREVEEALQNIPAVSQCAVVAFADAVMGERVCAFIVTAPGHSINMPAILEHFQALGLARQKAPERLEIVDAMPMSAGGKILKGDLKKRLAALLEAEASRARS
jgi:acyl-CoA synthetase